MVASDLTIRTPEVDLRVSQTSGDGLPVLLIHGSGASRSVFARQFESPLAVTHRLIAFDLPGHGQSSDARDPSHVYSLPGLAAAAGYVLDRLGVRRAAVYGWSLGGHVAIELASIHPAVAGLMLSGAPPVARGLLEMLRGFHANWDMLLASKKIYSERDTSRFERLCFGETGDPSFFQDIQRADGRLRNAVSRGMISGEGANQKRVVENAEFPVAFVNGENDPFIRPGFFNTLDCPSLWERPIVIEGVGHAPFWERPDLFNPIFSRFLDAVSAQEARRLEKLGRRTA